MPSQGSEFGLVFLIVPNPCFVLSRELLYTALTRQKEKVIIMAQGNAFEIKKFSLPVHSDTLSRITNLFQKPELTDHDGKFLEKNLIHEASDGKLLRSKSELLIYERLLQKGLKPEYEQKLQFNGIERYPDFTIEDEDTDEKYYWEHCGMMHDTIYTKRWEEKKKWYRDNGILQWKEGGGENGTLIVTEDKVKELEDGTLRGSISTKEVDEIISKVFHL